MNETDKTKLTKKEKRGLAKTQKQKDMTSAKRNKNLKNAFYVFLVIGTIVGGMWYLSSGTSTPSATLQSEFATYAKELGLDEEQFARDMESGFDSRINAGISSGNVRGINSTPTFYINDARIEPNPQSYDQFAEIIKTALSETEENDPVTLLDSDWVKGNMDSSVTVFEYADFQCPACANYSPIFSQLEKEFGEDVRFVFRHYPLVTIHSNAYPAANAAEAAGAQGKFWEMHDLLFQKQNVWSRL